LLFFPRTYDDKREYSKIAEISADKVANIKGRLSHLFHKRTRNGKLMTKAAVSDETGSIEVIWFNQPYLKRLLKNGDEIILSGKAKYNQGKLNLMSPSFEEKKVEQVHVGRIVPVYHQTDGITSKWIRDKIKPLINEWLKFFPEYLPPKIIEKLKLISYPDAIREAHFPASEESLAEAKKRLAFDELFLLQLKALQKKWHWQNVSSHHQKPIPIHSKTMEFINSLPYELTNAQKKVVKEILSDLAQNYPMSRLLQGDVGSGKTIVAAIAILNAIFSGYQAALMAPTEILAKQHYNTLFSLLKPFGLNIRFLSGSTVESEKNDIINQAKNGTADLLIGTHALIQDGVGFNKLGLAVIDEQHRFGVKQREILKAGGSPHLLNLSATPIPRTLAITIYGDQDLSIIDEMPKGRREILTRVVPENKREALLRRLGEIFALEYLLGARDCRMRHILLADAAKDFFRIDWE